MATASPFYVPQARPASIDDRLLVQLAKVGEDARLGMTTEAEAEWLLSVCGPLLRELLLRRQVMANLHIALPVDNVVCLPAVR
ncbi:MAG: hypothetical protein V4712_15125 [Pseudomonadota bacterium]